MSPSFTRFDLYRIIIPGALSLGFAVIAARVLSLGPEVPDQTLGEFVTFLEDPLRGFVLAFGVGLLAYFVDPGYATPEFLEGIPSAQLEDILKERDERFCEYPSKGFLGLYMLLFDEMLPEGIKERALLFGALFRVAVHAILGALLTALMLPIAIVALEVDGGGMGVGGTKEHVLLPLLAIVVTLLMAVRRGMVEGAGRRGRSVKALLAQVDKEAATVAGLIAASGVLSWGVVGIGGHEGRWGVMAVSVGVTLSAALWLIGRLGGRVVEYLRFVASSQRYGRPDVGYSRGWVFGLDACLTMNIYVGLYMGSPSINIGQQAGVVALTMFGLLLSFFRKHERQLHGVYSNQVVWIRRNIEKVEESALAAFGLE